MAHAGFIWEGGHPTGGTQRGQRLTIKEQWKQCHGLTAIPNSPVPPRRRSYRRLDGGNGVFSLLVVPQGCSAPVIGNKIS